MPSRDALWAWAREHPEEKIAGAVVFVDRSEWGDFTRLPVWPESELEVVGYDQYGRQVRVRWFEDFRYGDAEPLPPRPAESLPGIAFRPAWRSDDADVQRDTAAYWRRLGNLPAEVTPEERAKEVVLAAYSEGQLVGVVTASIGLFEKVRARVAMLRGSVDPDHRRSHVGAVMFYQAHEILEAWAAANPGERVGGVGGILESRELASLQRIPFWPTTRFNLIGFTGDGRQIRLRWFRDFLLD